MNASILAVFEARIHLDYPNSQQFKIFCEFCGERCIMDHGTDGTRYYQCNHHDNVAIKYLIGQYPDNWYTLVFACTRDDKYFFVSFFYDNNYIKEAFRIDQVFKKGSPASYAKTIFSLDFHPEGITPDNVVSKMSLWIPFS